MHGPGPFDDPFMFREPSPRGEGASQRRSALIGLAIIVVAAAVVILLLT